MSSKPLLRILPALALVLMMIPGPAEACEGCCTCAVETLQELSSCGCGDETLTQADSCDREVVSAELNETGSLRLRGDGHPAVSAKISAGVPSSSVKVEACYASASPVCTPDLVTLLGSLLL